MEKNMVGRRDFMKSTLAGFGGFFFLSAVDQKHRRKSSSTSRGKRRNWSIEPSGRRGEAPGDQHGGDELGQPQSHPDRPGFRHRASGHGPCLHAGPQRGGDRKRDQGTPPGFLPHRQQGEPAPGSHDGSLHRGGDRGGIPQEARSQPQASGARPCGHPLPPRCLPKGIGFL